MITMPSFLAHAGYSRAGAQIHIVPILTIWTLCHFLVFAKISSRPPLRSLHPPSSIRPPSSLPLPPLRPLAPATASSRYAPPPLAPSVAVALCLLTRPSVSPSDPRAGSDCCGLLLWTTPETSPWSGRRDASAAKYSSTGRAGTPSRVDRGWGSARRISGTAVGRGLSLRTRGAGMSPRTTPQGREGSGEAPPQTSSGDCCEGTSTP